MRDSLHIIPHGRVLHIEGTYKGVRVRQSTRTSDPEIANNKLKIIKKKIDAGTWDGKTALPATYDEVAALYLSDPAQDDLSASSRGYAEKFKRLWKGRKIDSFTPMDGTDYYVMREGEVKPGSIRRELTQAQAVLNYAHDPLAILSAPIVLRKPSEEEDRNRWERVEVIDKLAQILVLNDQPLISSLVVFLAHTGARLGEAFSMTADSVVLGPDMQPQAVLLGSRKGRRKKRRMRAIPLNKRAKRALNYVWPVKGGGLVWPAPGRNPEAWLSSNTRQEFYKQFAIAKTELGLDDFNPHDLRHCFGTWAALKGADTLKLMKLMGHTSPAMTNRYTHLNAVSMQDDVDFDSLDRTEPEQPKSVDVENVEVKDDDLSFE